MSTSSNQRPPGTFPQLNQLGRLHTVEEETSQEAWGVSVRGDWGDLLQEWASAGQLGKEHKEVGVVYISGAIREQE